MSELFPTPEEAVTSLMGSAAAQALQGSGAVDTLAFAEKEIQACFSKLRDISLGAYWCLKSNDRTPRTMRARHIWGNWCVPVRPRHDSKEYKQRAILRSSEGKKSQVIADDITATWSIWKAVTEASADESVSRAAIVLSRLKLAVRDAEFWKLIDDSYAAQIRMLGACL